MTFFYQDEINCTDLAAYREVKEDFADDGLHNDWQDGRDNVIKKTWVKSAHWGLLGLYRDWQSDWAEQEQSLHLGVVDILSKKPEEERILYVKNVRDLPLGVDKICPEGVSVTEAEIYEEECNWVNPDLMEEVDQKDPYKQSPDIMQAATYALDYLTFAVGGKDPPGGKNPVGGKDLPVAVNAAGIGIKDCVMLEIPGDTRNSGGYPRCDGFVEQNTGFHKYQVRAFLKDVDNDSDPCLSRPYPKTTLAKLKKAKKGQEPPPPLPNDLQLFWVAKRAGSAWIGCEINWVENEIQMYTDIANTPDIAGKSSEVPNEPFPFDSCLQFAPLKIRIRDEKSEDPEGTWKWYIETSDKKMKPKKPKPPKI